jgi:ABC-2 type transport system ATP-binding protein
MVPKNDSYEHKKTGALAPVFSQRMTPAFSPRPSQRYANGIMGGGDNGPAIRVVGLGRTFTVRGLLPGRPRGLVVALENVSLEVPAGTVHGLMGPNGSGKSTLLRILATLLLPTVGEAFVFGSDVTASPVSTRRSVGFSTGEERSFYWRLTGRQNLEFYAALYRIAEVSGRIEAVLDSFALKDVADRPVSTYSQGMLRRLGLARALLHEPPILLLDEPARSLDRDSRDHLHQILRELRVKRGTSVLLATHDLEEASVLCDAVSVLRRGRVVQEVVRADSDTFRQALAEAPG